MQKYELLLAPVAAWLLAQGIKYVIYLRKDGLQFYDLFASGGFPSSHTALIVSPLVIRGLRDGLQDPIFAVLTIVAGIVIYDAMGVRRTTGEQSVAIKELAAKTKSTLTTKVHRSNGHTPTEVAAGLVLGIIIGFGFYAIG
jgi:uncharacterized protein